MSGVYVFQFSSLRFSWLFIDLCISIEIVKWAFQFPQNKINGLLIGISSNPEINLGEIDSYHIECSNPRIWYLLRLSLTYQYLGFLFLEYFLLKLLQVCKFYDIINGIISFLKAHSLIVFCSHLEI